MEDKKKSLILYYDTLEILDDLSNEQAGEIFKAIKNFEINGELPGFKGELKMIWIPFKNALMRARKRWEDKCKKNRSNILKRWAKKNNKILPPPYPTNEYDGIRPYTNYTKHTERNLNGTEPEPDPYREPVRKDEFETAKEVFKQDL